MFKDIEVALDNHLLALAPGLPIAFKNGKYDVDTPDEPYIRPTMIFAPTLLLNLKDNELLSGSYVIDLFYPIGEGQGNINDKLDEIYSHFKGVKTVSHNGNTVYLREISRTTESVRDGAWFSSRIEINIKVYN